MRVTAAEAAGLARKREQPTRAPGDVLAVFVAGKLLNPLNASAWIWQKRVRYVREWKERVWGVLFEDEYWMSLVAVGLTPAPKHIQFLASTHNRMDSDGLQASLKPIRDALVECHVIAGDAEKDGNVFEYRQRIDRRRRGVEIRVRALTP